MPSGACLGWSLLWGLVPSEPCPAQSSGLHAHVGAPASFVCLSQGWEFELWSQAAWCQLPGLSFASWGPWARNDFLCSSFLICEMGGKGPTSELLWKSNNVIRAKGLESPAHGECSSGRSSHHGVQRAPGSSLTRDRGGGSAVSFVGEETKAQSYEVTQVEVGGARMAAEGLKFWAQCSFRCPLPATFWLPHALPPDTGIATLSFAFELVFLSAQCGVWNPTAFGSRLVTSKCTVPMKMVSWGTWPGPWGSNVSPGSPTNVLCDLENLFPSVGLSFHIWEVASATPLPGICLSCRNTEVLVRRCMCWERLLQHCL